MYRGNNAYKEPLTTPEYYGCYEEKDKLVDSSNWFDRLEAAKEGYAPEILQYDSDNIVRATVALNGQSYDLVNDANPMVQAAIAFAAITDESFLPHFPKGDVIARMNVISGGNKVIDQFKNINGEYDMLKVKAENSIRADNIESSKRVLAMWDNDGYSTNENTKGAYDAEMHRMEELSLFQTVYSGVLQKIYDDKDKLGISLSDVPEHIKLDVTNKLNEDLSFTQKAALSQARKIQAERD